MFGLPYHEVSDRETFVDRYRKVQAKGTSALIEVHTSRAENVSIHQALRDAVVAAATNRNA
jgi:hypothetical protein